MSFVRDRRGYTLVEVMVALVIVSILGIAMANIFRAQNQVQARQNTGVERSMNARAALDMLAREIRNAGYNPRRTANAGFTKTEVTEVEWTADLNGDGDTDDSDVTGDERVRYWLDEDTGELMREAAGVQVVVADNISGIVFTYLDEDLAEAEFDSEIEQVNIRLTFDSPAGSQSGAIETQVAIRNQIFEASACATTATLLIGGDLETAAKPSFLGCGNSVHVNGDWKVSGNPTVVAGSVTVSGTVDGSDRLEDEAGDSVSVQEGAPEQALPQYDDPFSTHCATADYTLTADGNVRIEATGVELPATGTAQYGWKRTASSPVVWTYDTNTEFPGTFCVEGSAEIKKDPGNGESGAMSMSVIAQGSIKVSGKPWLTADDPSGFLFLAGGDIDLKVEDMGSTNTYTGSIYAYSQCKLDGKGRVNGQLTCADNATPATAKEHASKNELKNDIVLTYNCPAGC
jgi:type IV pilus assembly protein PilW